MRSVVVVLIVALCGCDQDPFRLRERPVLAGYELQQWEDSKTFYLVRSGENDNGGGVLDGTVTQIGWNTRYIIAERKANFGGDKDGWMIIDTSTRTMSGPFSDRDLKARPEARGVSTMPAAQAWQRLH
jgi:hypothetical protein